MINGHGDDRHLFDTEIRHNFSSNVYYRGCPPKLLAEIASAVQLLENYPSPAAEELNEVAATRFQLNSDQFLFTNGATEAFYLIAHLFTGSSVAIVAPTFSEYEDSCKIHGLDYQLIDEKSLQSNQYQLVFICNPNNPDGRIIPTNELTHLVEQNPYTTFVIDEAYIEFTDKIDSIITLAGHLPNLIVVRSLTKTFTIPGLRLGYIVSSSDIIQKLKSKKMPWSVNALAIYAGQKLFERYDDWLFDVRELLAETNVFQDALSEVEWLELIPSHTSYFLVKLKSGTASALKDYLIENHGILIRDATNFKHLTGEYIRLSTQSTDANNILVNALKDWK